jgi:hypothetical protein
MSFRGKNMKTGRKKRKEVKKKGSKRRDEEKIEFKRVSIDIRGKNEGKKGV